MLKQNSDNERYTKVLLRTGNAYWLGLNNQGGCVVSVRRDT